MLLELNGKGPDCKPVSTRGRVKWTKRLAEAGILYQTAIELVFASNIFNGTGLTVLKTTSGLDDLLWTSQPAGTLYVVDLGVPAVLPKVSTSAL